MPVETPILNDLFEATGSLQDMGRVGELEKVIMGSETLVCTDRGCFAGEIVEVTPTKVVVRITDPRWNEQG
jgi:hypothetical protein